MRMIFSLMDADGDGKISLQEFQAAHERIFKAMDANKDGFVTLEEMQDFIRGTNRPASMPRIANTTKSKPRMSRGFLWLEPISAKLLCVFSYAAKRQFGH